MSLFQQCIYVVCTAMLPIIEVKGAIPFGVLTMGLSPWLVFWLAILGSSIPVPFILIYIEKLINWMAGCNVSVFKKGAGWLLRKVEKHRNKVEKWGYLAIFIFVAIPVPGTGVWTGSLIAAMLGLKVRYALPVIISGNIIASLIMIFITHTISVAF